MVKKIYRTMQGREIDLDALMARNETMPAIGNAKVNARGDQLGPGGVIIKKREEIIAEYYEDNPNAIPDPDFTPQQLQEQVQKKAAQEKAADEIQNKRGQNENKGKNNTTSRQSNSN